MSASKVVMKIVSISFTILMMLLIVFILYQAGEEAYAFGYRVFAEPPMAAEEEGVEKVVQVTADMSAKDIGDLLEKKELIRNSMLFVVQLKLSSYEKDIHAGTYTLSTSMTATEMMQAMSVKVEDTETEEE